MKRVSYLLIASVVLMVNCTQKGVDSEAERANLRRLDAELLKAAQQKDLKTFLSVHADNIATFVPNRPLLNGRDATRPIWSELFANPGFELTWQLTNIEVARAGDLAYESGEYSLKTQDSQGRLTNDRGKFVAVFKKQQDGQWKQVVDIWNSNLPLSPSTTQR